MITTYQIRNVLRVYGNQLKRRTPLMRDALAPVQQPDDMVDISLEARRKQMMNQMSNRLISQVNPKQQGQSPEGNASTAKPAAITESGL